MYSYFVIQFEIIRSGSQSFVHRVHIADILMIDVQGGEDQRRHPDRHQAHDLLPAGRY